MARLRNPGGLQVKPAPGKGLATRTFLLPSTARIVRRTLMAQVDVPLVRSQFGQTSRADYWWVQPVAVFLGLSAFIWYSTWAALQGHHYPFGPYLSPFYSPALIL